MRAQARRFGTGIGCVLFASVALASSASAAAFTPARFVVHGAPLVHVGHVVAGQSVTVFARPAVVSVDGCGSRAVHVGARGKVVSISAQVTCSGVRGQAQLSGTIRGTRLSGVLARGHKQRRFSARRVSVAGSLLAGAARSPALGAVHNVNRPVRYRTAELIATGKAAVPRTEIDLQIAGGARVGDVNAALAAVGGRIIGSVRGTALLVAEIPDPGSLRALDALRRLLLKMRGVARAGRATLPVAQDLPSAFASPPTGGQLAAVQHLLGLRMPAAWNARSALQMSHRPILLVADYFGRGSLDPHVDATVVAGQPQALPSFLPLDPNAHGYHVVGIAAGDLADDGTPAGLVTGVFPARTQLDVLDISGLSEAEMLVALETEAALVGTGGTHVVVSTSLGASSAGVAQSGAGSWITWVFRTGLANDMLQAASAGNDSIDATDNSPWTVAALSKTDFVLPNGQHLPPLNQTLVVENDASEGAPGFGAGCLAASSNFAGNIAAVGENVYSNTFFSHAGTLSGTSMATPQIAALGEYLWSIAPDLTAPEVAAAIRVTAPPLSPCQSAPPADAYAATLSLDRPGCFSSACAPVRFAILDQNNDGRFDQADLSAFAKQIFPASAPTSRDWSRFDLNGDGFTGGATKAPFDLDTTGSARAGAPTLSTVTQTVHDASGNPVQLQFDEKQATDADILCYYAYSSLYTPAAQNDQRDAILGNHCVPLEIVSCGTEADSTTFAQLGSSTPVTLFKDGAATHPRCSPALSSVLPANASESKTATGCGTGGASPCDAKSTASGTMTASGNLGQHGGTIQADAEGSVSGSETGGNSSANVNADASILFRVNVPACTFTSSGTVTSSTSGGGTVATPHVSLTGPSGSLMNVTTGTGTGGGILQPGVYALNTSDRPNGNADSSNATFSANGDSSGSVSVAC